MLTSRINCSSESAFHPGASDEDGTDAPRLPAQSASSMAASRSRKRPRNIGPARAGVRPALAKHRLCLGKKVRAVVEGLDIFDCHRPARLRLEIFAHREADVTFADLRIDGDSLLQRDRILDPRLEHPHFA